MLETYQQVVQEFSFLFSKEVALRTGEILSPKVIEFQGKSNCKHQLKRKEVTCPSYVNPEYSTLITLKYMIIFDLCKNCLGGFVEFIPNRKDVLKVIAK
ncbi:MAG: hypothetical protein FJ356_02040 [Thaumarchaeota archaeon]|nr:hypothetical protein [Nitrososphaerota archaeon]